MPVQYRFDTSPLTTSRQTARCTKTSDVTLRSLSRAAHTSKGVKSCMPQLLCHTPRCKSACAMLFTPLWINQRSPLIRLSSFKSASPKTKIPSAFHLRAQRLTSSTPSLVRDPPSGLVQAIIAITTSDLRNRLYHTTPVIETTKLHVTTLATGATGLQSPRHKATGIGATIAHVNAHPRGEKASVVTTTDLAMRRANTQGMNLAMTGAAVWAKARLAVFLPLAPTCRVFATHFFR
jgi:hypothetical protein